MKKTTITQSRSYMFAAPAVSTSGAPLSTPLLASTSNPIAASSSTVVSPAPLAVSTLLTPLTFNGCEESLSADQLPPDFATAPLLASGFRGTEYQLLVLLDRMVELNCAKQSFEAAVEVKGYGNLDDIILKIYPKMEGTNAPSKSNTLAPEANQHAIHGPSTAPVALPKPQPIQIEAYQVKYYKDPIGIYSFYNQEKTKNKNEKMHIGKFFVGWLNLIDEYRDLPEANIASIIYCNNTVDGTIASCLDTANRWKKTFVRWAEKVTINQIKSPVSMCKNVFETLGLSNGYSTKIWDKLLERNYIDENGCFTQYYHPEIDMSFVVQGLRDKYKVNIQRVSELIYQFYQRHCANQVDLFPLLYQQAWDYLKKKEESSRHLTLSDIAKTQLFQRFLRSFQFKINQPDLDDLERRVCRNLAGAGNKQSSEIFLSLYYAVRAWFRQKTPEGTMRSLNNTLLDVLIKEAEVFSKLWRRLQGRSEQVLSDITDRIEGQHIEQDEFDILRIAMRHAGVILVVGTKGAGKSALVRHALRGHHKENYLAFAANNLIGSKNKLVENAKEVLKKLGCISTVFIDAAEALVSMTETELHNTFSVFGSLNRNLVLTITPESVKYISQCLPQGVKITRLDMRPLSLQSILATFPMLTHYADVTSLMQLVRRPFFLSIIMKLIKNMGDANFKHMLSVQNVNLEYQIINLVIVGQDPNVVTQRRMAIEWLIEGLIKATVNNQKMNMPPASSSIIYQGLQSLIHDGVIDHDSKRNVIWFAHELFHDHVLINYIHAQWLKYQKKDKGQEFWQWLNNIVRNTNKHLILYQWLAYANDQLTDDIIKHIETIKPYDYFRYIKMSPIVNCNDRLFKFFLEQDILSLKETVHIGEYVRIPTVLLTILHNYKRGLKILLNAGASAHHPEAGRVVDDGECRNPRYDSTKIPEVSRTAIKIQHTSDNSTDDSDDDATETSNTSHTYRSSSDESSSRGRVYGDYYEDPDDSQNLRSSPLSDDDDAYGASDSSQDWEEKEARIQEETFIRQPYKYSLAGFNESQYLSDVDDDYIHTYRENERYHPKPNPNHHYLHTAIISHSTACLRVLLDTYARRIAQPAHLINDCEETPLHIAALHRGIDAAKMLLDDEWVETDRVDIWRETPLHNAVYQDDIEMAELLLAHDASPNIVNTHDIAPIHIAIMHLNIDMVQLLLSHGADLSRKAFYNNDGEGLSITDLLDEIYKKISFDHDDDSENKKEQFENFVIKLIELLNFGVDDDCFIWNKDFYERHPKTNTEEQLKLNKQIKRRQLQQVHELIELIRHRAQLSKIDKKFDYLDEETEVDYAIAHQAVEKIKWLGDYILRDDTWIARVFALPAVRESMESILSTWYDYVEPEYFDTLAEYAREQDDTELQTALKRYTSELDSPDGADTVEATAVADTPAAQSNDVPAVSTAPIPTWTTQVSHFKPGCVPDAPSFGISMHNSFGK